ncbi:nucleoside hydrolase [Bacillus fonticola]|uniref:nucleoside hydrolase n=1 Tax=Bacillus fonticola TaxID=2728853 RepID=UPI0014765224|nr:nucleoside hydrolase [Bacillus fonticola]
MPKRRKVNVIYVADFGIDDVLGLMYAYASEEINIVAIVADYGNIPKHDALRNAAYIRQLTNHWEVPVFAGAAIPLTGIEPKFYHEIHGWSGLGPLNPSVSEYDFGNFFELYHFLQSFEESLVVANVGRCTSLATMFVMFPEIMEKVESFTVMGGAFFSPGNVTAVSEANFYGDPYAANLVLRQSSKPVQIIPLDITDYAIITPQMTWEIQSYLEARKHPFSTIFQPMLDYYYQGYKKLLHFSIGSPIHDVVALWSLRHHAQIRYERVPTIVVTAPGAAFGQSIGDFRRTKTMETYREHDVALHFSYTSFIQDFYKTMTSL